MPVPPPFILFGPAHLVVLALAVMLPLALALAARGNAGLDRLFRIGLAALLAGGWIGWYAYAVPHRLLSLSTGLPLNLCDWAAAALIIALLKRNQFAYELGYFWGLGGTLQGLITPVVPYDFPDPQFVFFFINHAGVVAALLYLTFRSRRPVLASLPRVAAASIFYALVAAGADYLLHVNYGFLAAKPATASIMDFLSPWPWYIPELVLIGIVSLLVYYLPFALIDAWKRLKPALSV